MNNENRKWWARIGPAAPLIISLLTGSIGYSLYPVVHSPTPIITPITKAGPPNVEQNDPHIELAELLAKEMLSTKQETGGLSNCGVIDPPGDSRSASVMPLHDKPMKAVVFVQNSPSQKLPPSVVKCSDPSATWDLKWEFISQYWEANKR